MYVDRSDPSKMAKNHMDRSNHKDAIEVYAEKWKK